MAFTTLARQLQQEPAVRSEPAPSIYTMTPEQIYATYGPDTDTTGPLSRARAAAYQEGINGLTFNYGGQGGEGIQVDPQTYTVSADNLSQLYGDRDIRKAMDAAFQTQNPEGYQKYNEYLNTLGSYYPRGMHEYSDIAQDSREGLGGWMGENGWIIPAAIAAAGVGSALLGPAAGAGTATGETLTAPTGAAFTELMSSPYMASIPALEGAGAGAAGGLGGAISGATDLTGEGIEAAAGNGMGEWVEPATGTNWTDIAKTLAKFKTQPQAQSQFNVGGGTPYAPAVNWMNLGGGVNLGDFMNQAMRYGQQQDFGNMLNKKPYGYGGL